VKSERLIDVMPDGAREAFLGHLAYFWTYLANEDGGSLLPDAPALNKNDG
jgi:hypothetical protein